MSITPKTDSQLAFRIKQTGISEWSKWSRVKKMSFITISREYGCPAYPLSNLLKERLDKISKPSWAVFDREILKEVAKEHNLSETLLQSLGERKRSEIDQLVDEILLHKPSDYVFYKSLARTICMIAEKGHAIIVGRGSVILTNRMETGLHVRLIGSHAYRLSEIMRIYNLPKHKAEEMVKRQQQDRDTFVEKFTTKLVNNPYQYHLILNCEMSTLEEMVESILGLMRAKGWIKV
jgi:hypothetical protein